MVDSDDRATILFVSKEDFVLTLLLGDATLAAEEEAIMAIMEESNPNILKRCQQSRRRQLPPF
jgi:hypothetical protein